MAQPTVVREPQAFRDLVLGVPESNAAETYALCRNEEPIFYSESVGAWVLTRYEDVNRALMDEAAFGGPLQYGGAAGAAIHGRVLLHMSGEEHRKKVGLVSSQMRSPASLRNLAPMVRERCATLADAIPVPPESSDFMVSFVEPVPLGVITKLIDVDEATRFRTWYEAISGAGGGNPQGDPEVARRGFAARDELYAFFAPLIEQRRAHPGADLLSDLGTMEYEGERMTDDEIKAFMSFILVAGVETTARVLGSLVKQLVVNSDQWEQLVADPTLATAAAAEIIRFAPPHHATKRQLQQDIQLHGVDLAVGDIVLAVMGAANLDESEFTNAATFDISRFRDNANAQFVAARAHEAFGGGKHFCTGSLLAKLEMSTAVTELVQRFSRLEFVDGVVPANVGWPLRGPAALPIIAHRQ